MTFSRKKILIAVSVAAVLIILFVVSYMKKGGSLTVESPDDIIGTETVTQPMPMGGKVTHPDFGEQTYFSYGPIAGTLDDLPANGVLYGRVFQDGTYFHTINLNVTVAPEGAVYVGWLKNDAGDIIKTGRLSNRFGDVRYSLQFDAPRDLRAYKTVLVSREANDAVTAPTTIIAEGTLKESKQGR